MDHARIRRWAAWIGLDAAAVDALTAAAIDADACQLARSALLAGERPATGPVEAALAAIAAIPDMLELHARRGVSDAVSRATAADIALWIREHHRRTGAWGLSEAGWIRHHLAGRLFRLGRLQFMPGTCRLPLGPQDPLHPGDPVLEVHIPAGGPLLPAECLDAFAQAEAFTWPGPWLGFTCVSWLLGPRLPEVLPPDSNVLAFQRLFRPLPCTMDDRQTCERVLGMWPPDPETAPTATALQRAVLAWYRAGGRLDGGAGFRPRAAASAPA